MNKKFIVTRRFDNIARDLSNIYWLKGDQLKISNDEEYKLIPLKSRFQILYHNSDVASKIKDSKSNHQFIYSFINDFAISDNIDIFKFDVVEFKNYTDNLPRHYFIEES